MELAIYKVFRDAGIEEDKAQAIATTIWKAQEQNVESRQFANKADIEHHYAVHSKELATKGDIEQLRLETKADIERVRLEIEKSKNETVKWIIGSMVAIAAAALAAARFIFAS